MTSKHRQPGARATASRTSRTTESPGTTGSPSTTHSPGAGNSRHFWSSSWFTWTILAVGLIACGIYFWVTKIQPVIPELLGFITEPL